MRKFILIHVLLVALVSSSVYGQNGGSGEKVNCALRSSKEALCTSSCTSDIDCEEWGEKCMCDGNCGASCVDPDTRCNGRIPHIKNARKEVSGKNFGDTVKYTCRKPYTMFGDDTITCRAIGIWDRKLPRCEISCPDPGIPKNTKRQGGSKKRLAVSSVGSVLEYWCMPGYERIAGNTSIKCLPEGRWSGSPPVCELKSCQPPDIPDNAYIRPDKDSYKIGERITYHCDTGFSARGVRRRECRRRGWTSGEVLCTGKSCGDPRAPMNGKRIGLKFQYKSVVKFECDEGYMLRGPRHLTCQSNQKWSGPRPTCEVVDCGNPPIPFNGQVDGRIRGTSLGNTVRFKCKPGYMLRGAQERVCQANGTWSGLNTKCTEFVCLRPNFGGTLDPEREEYQPNSVVKFSCDGEGTVSGSSFATCVRTHKSAEWSTEIPKCYDCKSQPIGFEDGQIRKDQMTQGDINVMYKILSTPDPDKARLNGRNSWCPYKLNNKFLQVDLSFPFTINAIATQGDPEGDRWVHYYLMEYSNDQKEWFTYQENGEDKVLIGNQDRNSVKKNVLKTPVNARYVRIVPLCNPDGRDECMRIELYGCIDPKECISEGSAVWFQERPYGHTYTKGIISQINKDTVNIIHNYPQRATSPATMRKDNPVGMFMDDILQLKDVNIGDEVITMWRNRAWYYIARIRDIGKVKCYNRQYDNDGAWTLPADFRARKVHPLQFCKSPRK